MNDKTISFRRIPCPDCEGTGELRIESENIDENFVAEKQTVIAECPSCRGMGFLIPEGPAPG